MFKPYWELIEGARENYFDACRIWLQMLYDIRAQQNCQHSDHVQTGLNKRIFTCPQIEVKGQ